MTKQTSERRFQVTALLLSHACLLACMVPSQSPPGTNDPGESPKMEEPPPTKKDPPPKERPSLPVATTPAGEAKECDVDQLDPPHVYGAKVKGLLTGLPLTAEELAQLNEHPEALSVLVDAWLQSPQAEEVLRRFFMTAFQQNQVTNEALMMTLDTNNVNFGRWNGTRQDLLPLLIDNMEESFARTALRLVKEGRPFSEVLTTDTFEMTTALKIFYTFIDQRALDEQGDIFERPIGAFNGIVALRNAQDEPPAEQVLNPNSPNAMRVFLPDFETLCAPNGATELALGQNALRPDESYWIFSLMMGRTQVVRNVGQPNECRARPRRRQPLLDESDFSDWTTVRIRKPGEGEQPTRFFRLQALRNANELVMESDRVGFFTTLGFFGTWPTNEDNSSRVTINQTLITALGSSFDGTTVTDFSPPNLDEEHSEPGSSCYGCHQTLDPMRELIRQSYTPGYGTQRDQARIDAPAAFFFRGVEAEGQGVTGLAQILAEHPDFPKAWAQKLCFFTVSDACPEGSPELEEVVESFRESNLDFLVLARELLSSPLVTNARCLEEGSGTGHGRSIARRDNFCLKLSNRLGVDDICGLETADRSRSNLQRITFSGMASVPADTFSRGDPDPITISETGMFIRASREVVCTNIGERAFDGAFGDVGRDAAIEKMVTDVMGLPVNDPRHEGAVGILHDHVRDGMDLGATERNALRSALVLSCMSPGMAGVGL